MKQTLYFVLIISLPLYFSCSQKQAKGTDKKPIDRNATAQTQILYANLFNYTDSTVLFGHQDALAYGMGWWADTFKTDVCEVTGNHPAVYGWDLGHIGDSVNLDGVSFRNMKNWIKAVHARNGINTISWHVRNPVSGGNSWDTTKAVYSILHDEAVKAKFNHKLDLVADFFNSLKDDQNNPIPVIFRPYHEMNGFWFWWGNPAATPEEYIGLWRHTVDYLQSKGVHNILYSFAPNSFKTREEYLACYPGDDYVDILGYDAYDFNNNIDVVAQFAKGLEIMVDIADEKEKPSAFTETGLETVADAFWWTNKLLKAIESNEKTNRIVYVLVWRNGRPDHYYAPYPGQLSENDFRNFEALPQTIFLNEMPETLYTK